MKPATTCNLIDHDRVGDRILQFFHGDLRNNGVSRGTPRQHSCFDLASALPISPATLYHAGEPVFIQLTDLDQNLDPTSIETVLVTVKNDLTGDTEVVRLQETGSNTGVFFGYIQTTSRSQRPRTEF